MRARRTSRVTRTVVLGMLLLAMAAVTAWATSATGNQNPALRVHVSVTPTTAHAGDTLVARAVITNVTKRTLTVTTEVEFDTPTSGSGQGTVGKLAPGASIRAVFRPAITARTPKGTYTLSARASTRAGASHARAHATVS